LVVTAFRVVVALVAFALVFPCHPCRYGQVSNTGALGLYSKLGFVKEERMTKYYLNGGDAFRLKLWIDKVVSTAPSDVSGGDHNVAVVVN
jgi:hypothetical protein